MIRKAMMQTISYNRFIYISYDYFLLGSVNNISNKFNQIATLKLTFGVRSVFFDYATDKAILIGYFKSNIYDVDLSNSVTSLNLILRATQNEYSRFTDGVL